MESDELVAMLQAVRERVRAQHPENHAGASNVPLPELMPLVHARDAALGKVAAIGTVNPRRGGPVNALVQAWKRLVARVLDWHVRDQVEFNRKTVACLDAVIEALSENNRALVELGNRAAAAQAAANPAAEALKDLRDHWTDWRAEWERKLAHTEIQFLRSLADLQGAAQQRSATMETAWRGMLLSQHKAFEVEMQRASAEIQQRMWADMERFRVEYERIIHSELRTVRQRAIEISPQMRGDAEKTKEKSPQRLSPGSARGLVAGSFSLPFDYARFAEKFRGPEEYVKAGQELYLPYFAARRNVLDIGCGRGEFLEAMRAAGVAARGIDLSEESVALCRSKGIEAEVADLFVYLENLAEASLDGIFCSQVVEHLPPERLPEMIRLCASRLERGGAIAIETPNPECLAIFSTHFYLDPTHTRPVPSALLAFYMEEFGVGRIEVRRLGSAVESMPSLAELPAGFRDSFFGALDYAILGKKL
jgi:2-polyprenyl-3-methyl-5-hydroxy-6-metoxy-1,4-benzoquinol methylase